MLDSSPTYSGSPMRHQVRHVPFETGYTSPASSVSQRRRTSLLFEARGQRPLSLERRSAPIRVRPDSESNHSCCCLDDDHVLLSFPRARG